MLITKLNELEKSKDWLYYRNPNGIEAKNYQEAFDNSGKFIRDYFSAGGKQSFLYDSIGDLLCEPVDIFKKEEYEKRRRHIVTAFFMGIYFLEKIDALQFGKQSFLGKERRYLWAWFICSLYHDLFYNKELGEEQVDSLEYGYCYHSDGLLYSKDTLSKYYDKELSEKWCHDDKPHPDHGIVAAEKLHHTYLARVLEYLEKEQNALEKFLSGEDVKLCGGYLKISLNDYFSICKIAKIIACHNVYVCSEKDQEEENTKGKYENARLSNLMVGNPDFCYLPVVNEKCVITSYNKLYFLLALVDTLEPTKRGIDPLEIDINVKEVESHYEISISGGDEKYIKGVKEMGNWLNFVKASDDGRVLIIDFKDDKNNQKDDRVAEREIRHERDKSERAY